MSLVVSAPQHPSLPFPATPERSSRPMRFAYADPPYLGQGQRLYAAHHENAAVWDDLQAHADLIARLSVDYPDGWALSASASSLRHLWPLCPTNARVAVWVKTFCAFKKGVRPCYAWEPVIFVGGRNTNHPPPEKGGAQTTPKDFYEDWSEGGIAAPIALKKGLTGAKPDNVCRWILSLLNVRPGDAVVDLFPGTGAMTRAAEEVTALKVCSHPTCISSNLPCPIHSKDRR